MASSARIGQPVWLDLMTHDVEGARDFYGSLFEWEFTDQGADFGHYHLITRGDQVVGGMMSSLMGMDGPTEEPQGPTTWSVYLRHDDIDVALTQVPEMGGQVVFGPMDVADQGRQAYIMDPAGAYVGLWQPRTMAGLRVTGAAGTAVWFETLSTDFDAALPFYREVLRWGEDVVWMGPEGEEPVDGVRYVTFGAADEACAGLCDAAAFLPEDVPSFWRVYFGANDVDAAVEQAVDLGGMVLESPMDSPYGRFAQLADPQGAIFMVNSVTASSPDGLTEPA
ncbi:putative glyoxylase CFP32 [Austwickia sp. TVS 96-490-7B]|uniref:VOC family protein n=1 Tax=Austwickia sp. TVS 96-490-7B TaxID=2830843 RepID=UPI001C576CAF|nr:VOC family protein [Austwickia sp. TVS 96-490-7B]MBW3083892.1 putative glyoxylase CFP32 [Austwickia sp. TVS 96-490-7B]